MLQFWSLFRAESRDLQHFASVSGRIRNIYRRSLTTEGPKTSDALAAKPWTMRAANKEPHEGDLAAQMSEGRLVDYTMKN